MFVSVKWNILSSFNAIAWFDYDLLSIVLLDQSSVKVGLQYHGVHWKGQEKANFWFLYHLAH